MAKTKNNIFRNGMIICTLFLVGIFTYCYLTNYQWGLAWLVIFGLPCYGVTTIICSEIEWEMYNQ